MLKRSRGGSVNRPMMIYTCPMLDDTPQPDTENPVRLIVGMSRAGTTWVSKELSRHPAVLSYGETMVWGRKYRETDNADGSYSIELTRSRILLPADYIDEYVGYATDGENSERYEAGKLGHIDLDTLRAISSELRACAEAVTSPMTPRAIFEQTNRVFAKHTSSSIVIESTPNHLNFLDRILGAMPDAKIVAMLREPYAFMISYKHQGDRKHPDTQRTFRRLYHPIFCAMIWRRYSKSARDAIRAHESSVCSVWIDKLQAGKGAAMRELADFLLIPDADFFDDSEDHRTHKNTSFPDGKRPQLSHSDRFWMNVIGSGEMKQHRLEKISSGFHPLAVLGSLLKLPISAFHVVTIMGKRIEGSPIAYAKRLVFGK